MADFYIILSACLVAVSCSLLGCVLVLRKMAMLGDAISHAVLPGLVISYLIFDNRSSLPMLFGAATFGLLATLAIEYLSQKVKLQADASIGITFTFLFAIGIILISLFTGKIDLDQDCVLYGEIAYVPLDLLTSDSGWQFGPRAIWIAGLNLLLIIAFMSVAYKALFITTFNQEYAKTIGLNTSLWQYLLMAAVSLTTVFSFELVGAILVVAFLVVPPATAYLLSEQFDRMLLLSCIIAILSAISGFYLAKYLDAAVAGAMASMSGFYFVLAFAYTQLRKTSKPNLSPSA